MLTSETVTARPFPPLTALRPRWAVRLASVVSGWIVCSFACSAETSMPVPGDAGTGGADAGGSGGLGGTSPGSCRVEYSGEFCTSRATCSAGELCASYAEGCAVATGSCALGCRTDGVVTAPDYQSPQDRATALQLSLVLCEEYRLDNGPRRPGDACTTEFDCLPYAASVSTTGSPWPALLTCVASKCQEGSPIRPADYGASCAPERDSVVASLASSIGSVFRGDCDTGICHTLSDQSSAPGNCSMQCAVDADCPPGTLCRAISIGHIPDKFHIARANVCVDRCSVDSQCSPRDAGPDAAR